MSLPNTTLYYRDGSSDKVYQAEIIQSGAGYMVNFAYGRRGSTLKAGSKTSSPVDLVKATKIFEALVGEKTSKGYTPGADGTPYTAVTTEKVRGQYVPQLLNSIPRELAEKLIADKLHIMQEKKDGTRLILAWDGVNVQGSNKKGILVGTNEMFIAAIKKFVPMVLDGEAIGDVFWVFDLLTLDGVDLRSLPYTERWAKLLEVMVPNNTLKLVPTAITPAEKKKLFAKLEAANAEGVVFKLANSKYVSGRPSSGGNQLKFKFCETCSAIVSVVNTQRSVSMQLFDAKGSLINVGNVTIPSNMEIPAVGDIIEVRYLYFFKGGSLYQSVYLGKRIDVDADECTMSQLKFKPE